MKPVLQSIIVRFEREGIELSVSYEHGDDQPSPGTKGRTTRAGRMARAGLQAALEGLDRGGCAPLWGGYCTDTVVSRDTVLLGEGQNVQKTKKGQE